MRWMAPEAIELKRYNTETDVWAYGVLVWEVRDACVAFPPSDQMSISPFLKIGKTHATGALTGALTGSCRSCDSWSVPWTSMWERVELYRALVVDGARLPLPPHCPTGLYDVLLSCWELDPQRRPPFHKIHRLLQVCPP